MRKKNHLKLMSAGMGLAAVVAVVAAPAAQAQTEGPGPISVIYAPLSVSATQSQVNSPITVAKGDVITFDSTGSIEYGEDYYPYLKQHATLDVLPNGSQLDGDIIVTDVKYDRSAIAPSVPVGALVYRIGDGAWQAAEPWPHVDPNYANANKGAVADRDGAVVFAVNEVEGYRYDNTGAFTTTVTVTTK